MSIYNAAQLRALYFIELNDMEYDQKKLLNCVVLTTICAHDREPGRVIVYSGLRSMKAWHGMAWQGKVRVDD